MKNKELEIIKKLIKYTSSPKTDLSKAKRILAVEFNIGIVTNNWLLKIYRNALKNKKIKPAPSLENVLIKRKIRTMSGIAPVTVATKPYPCPGRCVYCPTDVRMPKSYLSSQPAAARALRYKFNPYHQTQGRLQAFYNNGHKPEKVELRILGGTWSYYDKKYQTWFIKELYRGLNEFNSSHKIKNKSLKNLQKLNEKAKHRCVGLSIETRPDWVNLDEIKRWRKFGVTKVEIGVQHLDKNVLEIIKRDHYKEDVIKATKLLKDAGFKVCYHIMPNLPGSNTKKDIKVIKEIFENIDFRPDQLKIYPCAVLKKTTLYKWYKENRFKTYSEKTLIKLIAKIKEHIPKYVRIERINRDVPSTYIVDGIKKINIRELVKEYMDKNNMACACIRCREIGHNLQYYPSSNINNIKLDIKKYKASGGKEFFISFESKNKKILYAFIRLRIPSKDYKKQLPIVRNAAIIRELHTYGLLAPLSRKNNKKNNTIQHKGLGKKLIKEAEKITKLKGYDKIIVISGIGVREYYRKLGYRLENEYGYMIKRL